MPRVAAEVSMSLTMAFICSGEVCVFARSSHACVSSGTKLK